jgi:hypothetical protein
VGVTSGKSFKKVTVFPGTPAIYQKVSIIFLKGQ